jgi:hypothetical protein
LEIGHKIKLSILDQTIHFQTIFHMKTLKRHSKNLNKPIYILKTDKKPRN